jgi:hypothetical protein
MGDDLRDGPIRGQGEPSFGVQVCSQDRRSWVILCGELDLASAPHLQQVLDQLCRDGYSEIVLDLSGLDFLGAAGLCSIALITSCAPPTVGSSCTGPGTGPAASWRSPDWTPC